MGQARTVGIFESGGARGFAHVGAVAACQSRNVKFDAVAGTSAGALVAALLAAGYTGDEILCHKSPEDEVSAEPQLVGLLACPLDALIAPKEWWRSRAIIHILLATTYAVCWLIRWGRLIGAALLLGLAVALSRDEAFLEKQAVCLAEAILQHPSHLRVFLGTVPLALPLIAIVVLLVVGPLFSGKGLLTTERFEATLNKWLAQKLSASGHLPSGASSEVVVRFRDLPIDLRIVAQEVKTSRIAVFSRQLTPDLGVARAVAASIAIPFLFQPVRIEEEWFVDGGAVSGFPAWAIDDIAGSTATGSLVLGFRLGQANACRIDTFPEYFKAVLRAMVFGDDTLTTRHVDGLNEIVLNSPGSAFDFGLSSKRKSDLYKEGERSALRQLSQIHRPLDQREVSRQLASLQVNVQAVMPSGSKRGRLRLNLGMPASNGTLQFVCPVGYAEHDCDDRLVFQPGEGACSVCFTERTIVRCDLNRESTDYEKIWGVDKYKKRLCAADLKTLLCVPVAAREDWDANECCVLSGRPVLGVLTCDTDLVLPDDVCERVMARLIDGMHLLAVHFRTLG